MRYPTESRLETDNPDPVEMYISVQRIKAGDHFVSDGRCYWTALENAEVVDGLVIIQVQFLDGGRGTRCWNQNDNCKLTIERER